MDKVNESFIQQTANDYDLTYLTVKEYYKNFNKKIKKMKQELIKLEDLQDFIEDGYMTFASSKRENKQLDCCLDGYLQIIVGNAIIWRGRDRSFAVDRYNSITEKYE